MRLAGLAKYKDLFHLSTWTECSFDRESRESMIENTRQVINFDAVKTNYLNALHKSEECAASVDALGEDKEGHLYFVEFKNGQIDKENIRNKVTESLLIFNAIAGGQIADTRTQAEFVLVYNSEKISIPPLKEAAIHKARLGKVPCPLYGLDKYYGVYFAKAYMMSAKRFEEKVLPSIL